MPHTKKAPGGCFFLAEKEGLEPPSGHPRQFSRLLPYQLGYFSGGLKFSIQTQFLAFCREKWFKIKMGLDFWKKAEYNSIKKTGSGSKQERTEATRCPRSSGPGIFRF